MNAYFSVTLLTPGKLIFEGQAFSLVVPTVEGKLGILANHAPLAAVLLPGDIVIKKDGITVESLVFHTSGKGFLHVLKNKIAIFLEDQGSQ